MFGAPIETIHPLGNPSTDHPIRRDYPTRLAARGEESEE
jgi:hypothetical protein